MDSNLKEDLKLINPSELRVSDTFDWFGQAIDVANIQQHPDGTFMIWGVNRGKTLKFVFAADQGIWRRS